MIRRVNDTFCLFLCQSADWQCVVSAEDEESAACLAAENIMRFYKDECSLSITILIKKLTNNLIETNIDSESVAFYSPTVLADAGYHNEAADLHNLLLNQEEENE